MMLYTGVVPIICQYTPSPGPLDDGFYKIQFVPDTSLFADATGADSDRRVIALNQRVRPPTTVLKLDLYTNLRTLTFCSSVVRKMH